jgi:hypothetical protein
MSEDECQFIYVEKEDDVMHVKTTDVFPISDVWDEHQNLLNKGGDVVILCVIEEENGKIVDLEGLPNRVKELMEI